MNRIVLAGAALLLAAASAGWAQSPSHSSDRGMMMMGGDRGMMMMGDMGVMGRQGLAGIACIEFTQMPGMTQTMMPMSADADIAHLKTALKITEAQGPAWDRFAETLRTGAKTIAAARHNMAPDTAATLPTRLARCEALFSVRLTVLKSVQETLAPLYVAFSDEQKHIADGLRLGPMGMM